MKDSQVQIFEVDGIRGTLKELSDYFNVDPISVSDKIAEGMSFQDALCDAKPGFKPAEPVKKETVKFVEVDEKTGIEKEFLPIVKEYFDNYESGIRYIDLSNKYHKSVWAIGNAVRKYKETMGVTLSNRKAEKPDVDKPVDNVDKPVEKVEKKVVDKFVVNSQPVSTSAVTDVQDLGDIVVITTTTTVVYRKAVK
jgi:hypothetical protein